MYWGLVGNESRLMRSDNAMTLLQTPVPPSDRDWRPMPIDACIHAPWNPQNSICTPVNQSSRTIPLISFRTPSPSKAWGIYPLTNPRPLWQLCQHHQLAVVFLTLVSKLRKVSIYYGFPSDTSSPSDRTSYIYPSVSSPPPLAFPLSTSPASL